MDYVKPMVLSKFALSQRIDYLKIIIAGGPSTVLGTVDKYAAIVDGLGTPVHGRLSGKPFKVYPTQGSDPQTWYKAFECWGPAADALARSLKAHEWQAVTRIDWREEIPTPPLSLSELEKRAHIACQGGTRITRDVSRLRSRREGRDGGGQLLGVGSHKSDSRLTVYIRGTAEWATEAQLSGKIVQQIISQALYSHSIEPFPPVYEAIVPILKAKLGALVLQRLALPIEVLKGNETFMPQEELADLLGLDPGRHKNELLRILDECGPEAVAQWVQEWLNESPSPSIGLAIITHESGTKVLPKSR